MADVSQSTETHAQLDTVTQDLFQGTYYLQFNENTKPWDDCVQHFEEHIQYKVDLEKKGLLLGAGPFKHDDGSHVDPHKGLTILRVSTREEAEEIANADPLVREGCRTFTLQRWQLNEGGIRLNITFSDRRAEVVG